MCYYNFHLIFGGKNQNPTFGHDVGFWLVPSSPVVDLNAVVYGHGDHDWR
jgi:hypothetical protein